MAKRLSKTAEEKQELAKYAADIRKLSLAELNKLSIEMQEKFVEKYPTTWGDEFRKYKKRKILVARIEELKIPEAQKVAPNQSLFEEMSKAEAPKDEKKEWLEKIEVLMKEISDLTSINTSLRVANNILKKNFEQRKNDKWSLAINLNRKVLMVDEMKASSIEEKWEKISQEYLDKL